MHGLITTGKVHFNLPPAQLVEMALARQEGSLADSGALVALTGAHTGRAPSDRFLVADPAVKEGIAWGKINHPFDPSRFAPLAERLTAYLEQRERFIFDGYACADPRYRVSVRVIGAKAWHMLFARCLLIRPAPGDPPHPQPRLTILHAPDLHLDPARDGTRSDAAIVLDLLRGLVLIAGTHYAGEIKKSVFSYLNYLLPQQGVLPMHCSANVGQNGDTALLFGLSGTGKTTLSADPERCLIGDDEHGWADDGIFNFEGGCYAKTIHLSAGGEPQIWNALRFGSVLENVVLDPLTRQPDFESDRITENTRAAYPIDYIPRAELTGRGGHPRNILFLTCDAFGVLPPLSKLSPAQALYHFLLGYTAKVAGTEAGVTEPQATFSTCFAAPFLPLFPMRYAQMLRERLDAFGTQVWLVNTGWTGGPYGQGNRIKLTHTRKMVSAILDGSLQGAAYQRDPIFNVLVPEACPGVPAEVLQPRSTWKDPAEYDRRARHLAQLFHENFQAYADQAPDDVRKAGPI